MSSISITLQKSWKIPSKYSKMIFWNYQITANIGLKNILYTSNKSKNDI